MNVDAIQQNLAPIAIAALLIAITAAIAFRVVMPKAIRWLALRKLPAADRKLFDRKQALLMNKELVEFLAPSKGFQRKVEQDEKKRKQVTWLSAYPLAVKAARRRHKHDSKRVVTLVRSQINEAARHISVGALPEEAQPANAGTDHFTVRFALNGQPKERVRSLAPVIESQLKLHSLDLAESSDWSSVEFHAHLSVPEDRLTAMGAGAEFYDEYPAERPTKLPLAVKVDGSAWSLPVAHSIVFGSSGSGKGSVLQGVVRQIAPYVKDGRARIWGIDDKNSEFAPLALSTLFDRYAHETEDAEKLIHEFHDAMMERNNNKRIDLVNAKLGRSVDFTRETPLNLLMIDELFSLIIALRGTRSGKVALDKLFRIFAKGRSIGFVVMGATQVADKEVLSYIKVNIANWVVLRIDSGYFNDQFLGEGAKAAGFDATAIPVADVSNAYRTAGIAYVKEDGGQPARVRFAYMDDRAVADLVLANLRDDATPDDLDEAFAIKAAAEAAAAEAAAAGFSGGDDGSFSFIEDELDQLQKEGNTNDDLALPALD